MSRRPILDLVDRVLDGKLAAILTEGRARGDSYEAIARGLATQHDLAISAEQIRKWCRDLKIPSPKDAA